MKFCILMLALLSFAISLGSLSYSLRNELSAANTFFLQHPTDNYELSLIYQPEFNLKFTFPKDISITSQAMGNALIKQIFREGDDYFLQRGKIYRLWVKGGISQTEARIGLQRLNFGSAQILRPLQWFDNLNPSDKLEQTDGVQAGLLRHYFLNNANIWFWGIRGEGKTLGQVQTVTKADTPELGGRFQYPLTRGEIAIAVDHRQKTQLSGVDTGAENRIGLDARWDFGIGVWVEGYISKTEKPLYFSKWIAPVTTGADYTIGVGNGIYCLFEAQILARSDDNVSNLHNEVMTYAFEANYPVGILDRFMYYGAVKDDGSSSVHTIIWRREYDRLGWDLSSFWDAGKLYKSYHSRGIKLLISYTF